MAQSIGVIPRGERNFILGGMLGVTALAWGYLFVDAWRMNHGASCCAVLAMPQLRAWPVRDLVMLFVMWSVMMVAMMTPTAGPMVMLFAAVQRQRRATQAAVVPAGVFLAGYLLVWVGFSLAATVLQWGLHAAALLSPAMVSTSPWLGGGLLIAAGVFQFTPMKRACLRHCRSPLDFLLTGWRDGRRGALVMGLRHGLSCTGCCWLLMALLFVLGVMNLAWVAAITAFVVMEKTVPGVKWLNWVSGAACVVWGVVVMGRAIG